MAVRFHVNLPGFSPSTLISGDHKVALNFTVLSRRLPIFDDRGDLSGLSSGISKQFVSGLSPIGTNKQQNCWRNII